MGVEFLITYNTDASDMKIYFVDIFTVQYHWLSFFNANDALLIGIMAVGCIPFPRQWNRTGWD